MQLQRNHNLNIPSSTLDWLLSGDPAIRWQVQRDLLGAPEMVYSPEQQRVASEGWGAQLLALQDPDGRWGSGLYSPKWISTTYTLLLLCQMGLPPENPQARRGCEHFWRRDLYRDGGLNIFRSIDYSEVCVNGMILGLSCYFQYSDQRIHNVAEYLLTQQMVDGGWNCERIHGATHASFHTTIMVLEGLAEYRQAFPGQADRVRQAEQRAWEFLLQHRLYHSHRTGQVIHPSMTRLNFPTRWHYDFLRALDYFRAVGASYDERMADGIELLKKKRTTDGLWLAYRPFPGRSFFELEETGQPSRWNTLRALRVLGCYAV